ncbi:MAG: hypothetical protein PHV36_06185 [Elusimicrobiales bacterium]|nr:hypothetical protein [Elusimicrobiales bacterium]
MKTLKFIWLDDSPKRKRFVDALNVYVFTDCKGKEYSVAAKFVDLSNLDPIEETNKQDFTKYDLVVIDHVLSGTTQTERRGSTLANIVSDKAPNIPIFGITADDKLKSINSNAIQAYEELFLDEHFSNHSSTLASAAIAFKTTKKSLLSSTNTLVNMFAPAEEEKEILLRICPRPENGIKLSMRDVYRFKKELFAYPGPLLDDKWVANVMGVKHESFKKFEALFTTALYKGIFCTPEDKRWWRGAVKSIIFKNAKNAPTAFPWEAGHNIVNVLSADHVKCGYCNERYPEVLGYSDASKSAKLIPLHIKCSKEHPYIVKKIYFEDIRIQR